jgi:archaemetzincin
MESFLTSIATTKILEPPKPGEWIFEHKESGQTLQQYCSRYEYSADNRELGIILMGSSHFSQGQRKLFEITLDYLAVLYQCKIKIITSIEGEDKVNELIPATARRVHPSWGNKQYLAPFILEWLITEKMKLNNPNCFGVMAFVTFDLYPSEHWNFVFGRGSPQNKVGVWSINRFDSPDDNFKSCLRRTMAVASHELAHVIGLHHCIYYDCLMNGSNSGEESERRPLNLCPVCLDKLLHFLSITYRDENRDDVIQFVDKIYNFVRQYKNELKDMVEWCESVQASLKYK